MAMDRLITLHQPSRLEVGAGAVALVGAWAEGAGRVLVITAPPVAGLVERLRLTGTVRVFAGLQTDLEQWLPQDAPGWVVQRYETLVGSCGAGQDA